MKVSGYNLKIMRSPPGFISGRVKHTTRLVIEQIDYVYMVIASVYQRSSLCARTPSVAEQLRDKIVCSSLPNHWVSKNLNTVYLPMTKDRALTKIRHLTGPPRCRNKFAAVVLKTFYHYYYYPGLAFSCYVIDWHQRPHLTDTQ